MVTLFQAWIPIKNHACACIQLGLACTLSLVASPLPSVPFTSLLLVLVSQGATRDRSWSLVQPHPSFYGYRISSLYYFRHTCTHGVSSIEMHICSGLAAVSKSRSRVWVWDLYRLLICPNEDTNWSFFFRFAAHPWWVCFFCCFFIQLTEQVLKGCRQEWNTEGKKNTEMWKYTSNLIDSTRRLPFLLEALLPALD